MTPTQTKIYKLIKKGKIMNVSDMARSLGFTRQHFTEQLNKLKEKGLVVEQPRFIAVDWED